MAVKTYPLGTRVTYRLNTETLMSGILVPENAMSIRVIGKIKGQYDVIVKLDPHCPKIWPYDETSSAQAIHWKCIVTAGSKTFKQILMSKFQ